MTAVQANAPTPRLSFILASSLARGDRPRSVFEHSCRELPPQTVHKRARYTSVQVGSRGGARVKELSYETGGASTKPGFAPTGVADEELGGRRRTPGAALVGLDRWRILEQLLDDAPGLGPGVLSGELRRVALHGVRQQPLVGFGRLPELVGEDQREVHGASAIGAGRLRL